MKEWMVRRMQSPSTYVALGLGVVGVGILTDNFWVIVAGVVVGAFVFVLKESQ
jgi:hypothetical protein